MLPQEFNSLVHYDDKYPAVLSTPTRILSNSLDLATTSKQLELKQWCTRSIWTTVDRKFWRRHHSNELIEFIGFFCFFYRNAIFNGEFQTKNKKKIDIKFATRGIVEVLVKRNKHVQSFSKFFRIRKPFIDRNIFYRSRYHRVN